VLFNFFVSLTIKITVSIIFVTFINSIKQKELEDKMKKIDSMLSLRNAEINVNIDVRTNVKLGKRGGGGLDI
jgi:hypothetical protein